MNKEEIKRAIYMLRVAARFIEEHPVKEYEIVYDEATCDGGCLREDCETAAQALEDAKSEVGDWELACPMCGKKECCGLACQAAHPPAAEPQQASEHCHANRDGECNHKNCPQLRDGEPKKSGRSCPLPQWEDE